ncbi:PH domain-containing protein [Gulosibacter hominis]|uniref:PH domain-containing protein n=1 Tax=Gulosibacter hominis TaxID=2770504 RepID=UPI0019186363|nr:PH domain-containing protein [Gulosibacter hominis]
MSWTPPPQQPGSQQRPQPAQHWQQPGQQNSGPQQPGQFQPVQFQPGQPPQYRQQPGPQQPGPQHPQQPQHNPYLQPRVTELANGDWHRLHPLTPWLRVLNLLGGVLFMALIIGVPLAGAVFGDDPDSPRLDISPGTYFVLVGIIALVIFVLGTVGVVLGYRATEFRVTDEVLELRSGVFARNFLQARLDRLQSVNINRPLGARMLGLSHVATSGASDSSEVELKYLGQADADALRDEVLRRASGAKRRKRAEQSAAHQAARHGEQRTPSQSGAGPLPGNGQAPGVAQQNATGAAKPAPQRRTLSDFVDAVVDDFSGSFASLGEADSPTIVTVPAKRLAGVEMLKFVGAALIMLVTAGILWIVFGVLASSQAAFLDDLEHDALTVNIIGAIATIGMPLLVLIMGAFAVLVSLPGNMQYNIAGTPDGLRVGKGLLTTNSDTIAPGRIHAVEIQQPFWWRMFGWYRVRINRADVAIVSSDDSDSNQISRTVLLPVGKFDDVIRVLSVAMPMQFGPHTPHLMRDLLAAKPPKQLRVTPARAWFLAPFGWKRNAVLVDRGVVYLRRGRLERRVSMIPAERMQGLTISDGPWRRLAGTASLQIGTVLGPVLMGQRLVARSQALQLFEQLAQLAIQAAQVDRSHRWAEAGARMLVQVAQLQLQDARAAGAAPDPRAVAIAHAADEYQRQEGQR